MLMQTECASGVAQRILGEHGIVARMTGKGLEVPDGVAGQAAKILARATSEHAPAARRATRAGDDEPDDTVEEQLRRTIKTLEKKVDDLIEENRKLRKGKKPDDDGARHHSRTDAERRAALQRSIDKAASTVREVARATGQSAGDVARSCGADTKLLGLSDAELLPSGIARAAGLLPSREEQAFTYDASENSVSCNLMSREDAAAVSETMKQRLGR